MMDNNNVNSIPQGVMDGEFDPDYTDIKTCPDCGSWNVTTDMNSNQMICLECKKSNQPKMVNFSKEMEKRADHDKKVIEDAIKGGQTFGNI
jgi:reverse gyrase